MVKITDEMKEVFGRMKTPVVATVSAEGNPNVVPIAYTRVFSDSEILLMDNYMNKTRANIDSLSRVAISVWDPELRKGYQFKGNARIVTSGTILDEGIQWVKSRRPQINPKAAIVVTVDEIYLLGGGENAGRKVA